MSGVVLTGVSAEVLSGVLASRLDGVLAGVLASRLDEPPDEVVTPGTIGFVVTFFVAVAVVLLVRDLSRRVRRLQIRAEERDAAMRRERGELGEGAGESGDRDVGGGDVGGAGAGGRSGAAG